MEKLMSIYLQGKSLINKQDLNNKEIVEHLFYQMGILDSIKELISFRNTCVHTANITTSYSDSYQEQCKQLKQEEILDLLKYISKEDRELFDSEKHLNNYLKEHPYPLLEAIKTPPTQ